MWRQMVSLFRIPLWLWLLKDHPYKIRDNARTIAPRLCEIKLNKMLPTLVADINFIPQLLVAEGCKASTTWPVWWATGLTMITITKYSPPYIPTLHKEISNISPTKKLLQIQYRSKCAGSAHFDKQKKTLTIPSWSTISLHEGYLSTINKYPSWITFTLHAGQRKSRVQSRVVPKFSISHFRWNK